jgi:hypothetical protein
MVPEYVTVFKNELSRLQSEPPELQGEPLLLKGEPPRIQGELIFLQCSSATG